MAKGLFQQVFARLRSAGAETLAETLVGILIASLSMVLLVSATAASTSIVQKTRKQARTYYAATSSLAATPYGETGSVNISERSVSGATSLGLTSTTISVSWNEQVLYGSKTGISYSRDEG